jgi:mono/diheme cytochrome c family protein
MSPGAPQASSSADEETTYDASLVASGREVAIQHCATCHAVDAGQRSPLSEAPSFQGILARYDSDRLAEDLIEGIRVGHDQMPVFDLDVRGTDALVAYLEWLDKQAPAQSPHR